MHHYIAFKLLAEIRHQVFAALRKLAPAKLDGSDKGNLISIITTDIELLEVFYAHTISPIAIAIITSLFMSIFISIASELGYLSLPDNILIDVEQLRSYPDEQTEIGRASCRERV